MICAGRKLVHVLVLLMLSVINNHALAQQVGDGKALYFSYKCSACHGYVGQGNIGGVIGGPSLAPKTLPIEAFVAIVRKPYGRMPAYPSSLLSDSDLELIYKYVSRLPKPPKVTDIPALKD